MAQRVPSFVVATICGTPIAIVRRVVDNTVDAVKCARERPLLFVPAMAIGVPACAMGGLWDGLVTGPVDAWEYSADQPFSKQAFSLGDMHEF